jgi:hypothetical protein
MRSTFILARRATRSRASILATLLALAFSACNSDELTNTTDEVVPTGTDVSNPGDVSEEPVTAVEIPSQSVSFAGGIPMGHFEQPLTAFGSIHNGAKMNIPPSSLLSYLSAIKARGGKVVLMMAGSPRYYKDGSGHFSLDKWKARVDRFRNINFSSYITSGTVIGHFLLDEPNDPSNWNGRAVSSATVDEMARYSKARWSNMATIVRTEPAYFKSRHPRYLDAAWAQYVTRKGAASDFIKRNVADAQNVGVALVVGLNISAGGNNHSRMSASQVKSFGSAMLSSSYPCAMINWQYGSYLTTTSMRDALKYLRSKAQNRSSKSCRH